MSDEAVDWSAIPSVSVPDSKFDVKLINWPLLMDLVSKRKIALGDSVTIPTPDGRATLSLTVGKHTVIDKSLPDSGKLRVNFNVIKGAQSPQSAGPRYGEKLRLARLILPAAEFDSWRRAMQADLWEVHSDPQEYKRMTWGIISGFPAVWFNSWAGIATAYWRREMR